MAKFKEVTVKRWVCSEPGCEDYFADEALAASHEARHVVERCTHSTRVFDVEWLATAVHVFEQCAECSAEGLGEGRYVPHERFKLVEQAMYQELWDEASSSA